MTTQTQLAPEKLERYKEAVKEYYRLKFDPRASIDLHDRVFMENLETFAQCHQLEL